MFGVGSRDGVEARAQGFRPDEAAARKLVRLMDATHEPKHRAMWAVGAGEGLRPSELIRVDSMHARKALMYELAEMLKEIAGMKAVTLQPAAGAHGELTGILLIKKYHEKLGNQRHKLLVVDSAHGTNPASAALGGYECVSVKCDASGCTDMDDLRAKLDLYRRLSRAATEAQVDDLLHRARERAPEHPTALELLAERAATDLVEAEVHLPLRVGEEPEPGDLVRHPDAGVGAIGG